MHFSRALILVLILAVSSYGQNPPATTLAEFEDLATTLVTLQSQQERERLLDKNKALVTPDLRKARNMASTLEKSSSQNEAAMALNRFW